MKQYLLIAALFFASLTNTRAQSVQYMYITVCERLAGPGDTSTLIVTESDGTQNKIPIKRITKKTSLLLNEEEVQSNDAVVIKTLNEYSRKGWRILSTNYVSNTAEGTGTFLITRYVLEKKEE